MCTRPVPQIRLSYVLWALHALMALPSVTLVLLSESSFLSHKKYLLLSIKAKPTYIIEVSPPLPADSGELLRDNSFKQRRSLWFYT